MAKVVKVEVKVEAVVEKNEAVEVVQEVEVVLWISGMLFVTVVKRKDISLILVRSRRKYQKMIIKAVRL